MPVVNQFDLDQLKHLPAEYFRRLYRRHANGAIVRSGASLAMWLFALIIHLAGVLDQSHFLGISVSVAYLILINPPTLWVMKRSRNQRAIAWVSILINILEVAGYTAIIFFAGGIEATYLTPIYAALILYVGAYASRRRTFSLAAVCAAAFAFIVLGEVAGLVSPPRILPGFDPPISVRLAYLSVAIGLLFVVAYISAFTTTMRNRARDMLKHRNLDLEEQTLRLQYAEAELRKSQTELETRVEARTGDLSAANEELRIEIAERIAAEKSLKESHETFLTVLDGIDATLYVADLKTHEVLFMNKHMRDSFGADFTGARCWEVFRREPRPCPHCTMGRLLDGAGHPTGVQVWESENPVTGRWYINYDRAIKWLDGRWVFLQIATDITRLKTLELERIDAETKLHHAQKMEAMGLLAGGVAHDLNNILSGIVSYPQLLLLDLPADSPLRDPIQVIKRSGERAAAIVQDLLALARRAVLTDEIVDLNEVARDYLASPEYEKLSRYHPGCRLEVECPEGLLKIVGSPVHLSKSIMNLVSNAFEAMPDGGRAVVSTANCYIDATRSGFENVAEGEYVLLRVADSGIGISEQDRQRIFEPFYTKKVLGRSGTGLGMSVVWGTVKDHKGFIDVESTLGAGTRFSLYYPATRKEPEKKGPRAELEAFRGRGESVLVIDDVAEQRDIACGILNRLGYKASAVASGEKALELLSTRSVDLLVIDMIMDPGMDGLDTYRAVLATRPGQKAVIASGFSETDRVRAALEMGAGAYVRKPYTMERIGSAVKETLSK
jgi:signal transduction histidine kinase